MSEDFTEEKNREPRPVKVTDKRMFGPDGELREEYKQQQSEQQQSEQQEPKRQESQPQPESRPGDVGRGSASRRAASPQGASPGAAPGSPSAGAPAAGPSVTGPTGAPSGAPAPDMPPGAGPQPSFFDLISILAEPVAIYLGDAKLPDGRNAENLEMARLHIDLLNVLEDKTRGNLSEREKAILEDLLYRLRMRYVQKTGQGGGQKTGP